jgi:hypothetical protein
MTTEQVKMQFFRCLPPCQTPIFGGCICLPGLFYEFQEGPGFSVRGNLGNPNAVDLNRID